MDKVAMLEDSLAAELETVLDDHLPLEFTVNEQRYSLDWAGEDVVDHDGHLYAVEVLVRLNRVKADPDPEPDKIVPNQFSLGGCVEFFPRRATNIAEIVNELRWTCRVCNEAGVVDLDHPQQLTQRQAAAEIQHRHGKGKGGCTA